jgi:bifunctional non-homologous end joining protein LigD
MPGGIEVKNRDKVFWPATGETKGDLLDYLEAVSDHLLPFLRNRPLTLIRYPDGVGGFSFYQKNTPSYAPEWVKTVKLPSPGSRRGQVSYTLCNSKRTLMWLANQAAIEFHPWLSRVDQIERPDFLVFDLDPPPGRFEVAVDMAFVVRDVLAESGLEGVAKTSGSKGVHVYVPIHRRYDYGTVRRVAVALAAEVEGHVPDAATTEFRIANRAGRLFLDVGRNAPGAHIVAPYSPRARDEATVSFPVSWDELRKVKPKDLTIHTVPGILQREGDLWRSLSPAPQSLSKLLGRVRASPPG